MSRPLPFRQVGTLTGEELERAHAWLARLPRLAGYTGPSRLICPHPPEAHVTEAAMGRDEPITWCPWCSFGDAHVDDTLPLLTACGDTLRQWLATEVDAEADPVAAAHAESLRASGWAVNPPSPGKAPRRATAWEVAAALKLPRKLVAQLLRWLQRAELVEAVGTAEAVWAESGERAEVTVWRAT